MTMEMMLPFYGKGRNHRLEEETISCGNLKKFFWMILVAFFILISSIVVESENPACEQLVECYARSRAKTEECLSHIEERVCWNESLQSELKKLNDERISLHENCLREKLPTATAIENAKKKAKCNAILRKNPNKSIKPEANEKDRNKEKNRRSILKSKKNNEQQKLCLREARKLKNYCGQLSKCCTITKLCKVSKLIDEKISAKRMEIKEVEEQCRLEHHGSVKVKDARNNKRGGHHRGSGQRRKLKNQDSDV